MCCDIIVCPKCQCCGAKCGSSLMACMCPSEIHTTPKDRAIGQHVLFDIIACAQSRCRCCWHGTCWRHIRRCWLPISRHNLFGVSWMWSQRLQTSQGLQTPQISRSSQDSPILQTSQNSRSSLQFSHAFDTSQNLQTSRSSQTSHCPSEFSDCSDFPEFAESSKLPDFSKPSLFLRRPRLLWILQNSQSSRSSQNSQSLPTFQNYRSSLQFSSFDISQSLQTHQSSQSSHRFQIFRICRLSRVLEIHTTLKVCRPSEFKVFFNYCILWWFLGVRRHSQSSHCFSNFLDFSWPDHDIRDRTLPMKGLARTI